MTVSRSPNSSTHAVARYAAAFLLGILISTNAMSQNLGTAFSDLWWNPAESGWGVTVDHQQDVMFLTFFIYRADNSPYWVVGILDRTGSNALTAPPVVFTGDLLETKGPRFSTSFDPALVTNRKVGTATFSGSLLAATLQYSVDGVSVTKNIVRQTLREVSFAGQYAGSIAWTSHDCLDPANNNVTVVDNGTLTLTQSGTTLQLTAQGKTNSCVFRGTYSQQGSLGQVDAGTYTCDNANAGTVTMNTLQWTNHGMTAGLAMKNASCSFRGYVGGITRAVATPPARWSTLSFVISPDVYTVVSETNQNFTILAVWKPGQRDLLHSHQTGSTNYFLTECSLRSYPESGESTVSTVPAGHVGAPWPGSHVAENIGSSDCRVLFFEPK